MDQLRFYILRGVRIIQRSRRQLRMSFQASVREHGMDDRSLLKLDDITSSHDDEREVKNAQSIHDVDIILKRYQK